MKINSTYLLLSIKYVFFYLQVNSIQLYYYLGNFLLYHFLTVRFLDSHGRLSIPDHFIPFGLGERRCPGEALVDMEVYLFFTHIMHQLNIRSDGTIRNLESDYRVAIQPKPFKIIISGREDYQQNCLGGQMGITEDEWGQPASLVPKQQTIKKS